jgi:hypothetical protein
MAEAIIMLTSTFLPVNIVLFLFDFSKVAHILSHLIYKNISKTPKGILKYAENTPFIDAYQFLST